ncbi:hypothetical protein [Silvanigrella sp.]|jgi:hypothetical protein|uniref:hypothetical protein n=1 Tax=Silvanigrella sp. TaxID=2024976 RepID=UPI0037C5F223
MKKHILHLIYICILFFSFHCYGSFKVEFYNNYEDSQLLIQRVFTNRDVPISEIFLANKDDKVLLNDNGYFIIHFTYTIKFEDTNIPCSWVNLYGVNYANGWGIKMILNDSEVGTICINKKFIIDTKARAILEYYQGHDKKTYLKFYNDGWWQNSNSFPNSLNIKLE